MKTLFAILFLLISGLVLAQASSLKNEKKYKTLTSRQIKSIYKKETPTHKVGKVTYYSNSRKGKIQTETCFENIGGELFFLHEYVNRYDDNDSLVYYSYFTEGKGNYFEKSYWETYLNYPSDSITYFITFCNGEQTDRGSIHHSQPSENLKIKVETSDKRTDSTLIRTLQNEKGEIIQKSEITKYSSDKENWDYSMIHLIEYCYNERGQLIQRTITDKKEGDFKEITYEYEGDDLRKCISTNTTTTMVTTYQNGLLETREITNPFFPVIKTYYQYTPQGKLSQYKTIDESTGNYHLILKEYDKADHLRYGIELVSRDQVSASPTETVEISPEKRKQFIPFKTNRRNGLYEIVYKDDNPRHPLLNRGPFLIYEDVQNFEIKVNEWGIPSLLIDLTEEGWDIISGKERKNIALVLDNRVVSLPVIRQLDEERKVEIIIADTLTDTSYFIHELMNDPHLEWLKHGN